MIRAVVLTIVCLSGLALCMAGFYFGRAIPFAQQWPLFEALRNTAAIIFAVVGAWLAIIYPERLKLSFGKSSGVAASSNGNVGLLLTPAVHSTIILVCLLLIGVVAPILKQVPGVMNYVDGFRGTSFFLLTSLTLWQVAIVIVTILPADLVKANYDNEQTTKKLLDAQDALVQQKLPEQP